jgi:cell division protein FtsB
MVIRPRIRAFLAALGLYALAALFIGYFGINAYTGNHGIVAKQNLEARIADLTRELDATRAERVRWEHRVALLRSDRIDPDMLDERARQLLNYTNPRDVTMLIRNRDWPASGRKRAPRRAGVPASGGHREVSRETRAAISPATP